MLVIDERLGKRSIAAVYGDAGDTDEHGSPIG
jgi:hypothetical protein